ncbi:MAG: hypothetical protein ABUS56_02310 [Acidobacteriota bacterium]
MSDPLRTDGLRAVPAAPEVDRDAKIEQLLLVGLDHYFAGQFDDAVHVWTRVLFLDRSHARARAYIERARSALAERQREAEELLQRGVAAVDRGDTAQARHLLQAAIESGAAREEAAAAFGRLQQLEPVRPSAAGVRSARGGEPAARARAAAASGLSWRGALLVFAVALGAAMAYSIAAWGPLDWRALLLPRRGAPVRPADAAVGHTFALAPPRRGALALAKARTLVAEGHLSDALRALDVVRATDVERAEADRLRGDIQRQLIALAETRPPSPPRRAAGERAQ